MIELVSHLEYLILQHECVIIPDFGGFVLNKEPSTIISETGTVIPPSYKIGFNSELKFNDGLLAGSYMQRRGITFDEACKKIRNTVKYINFRLNSKQPVRLGKLGSLQSNDGKIQFISTPEKFIHPDIWGYSSFTMNRIEETISLNEKKVVKFRRGLLAVGSAAAVLFVVFLSTHTSDNHFIQKIQQSGFFYNLYNDNTGQEIEDKSVIIDKQDIVVDVYNKRNGLILEEIEPINDKVAQPVSSSELIKEAPETPVVSPIEQQTTTKQYYIIVGGDTNRSNAENLLSKIKNTGFPQASIIESSERYRIYVASFNNNEDANTYLKDFVKKYPAYGDAWVFRK